MKPSARVALIVALATTAPTWASLPFYSPDYTFDSTTGTGFIFVNSGGISSDGRAAHSGHYHESHVWLHDMIATWRGQTLLPTPQEDNDHLHPKMYDINRHGSICGYTIGLSSGARLQPAVWRPDGTRIDLPLLFSPLPDEPADAYAVDMNDAGVVVGWSTKRDEFGFYTDSPVYWTPSFEIVELANPLATSHQSWNGRAVSISSNGIIAGSIDMSANVPHAMKWDIHGTATVLSETTDTGITFTSTIARRSLDDGTIVGSGKIGNSSYGILWTPSGDAIELRNLPDLTNQEISIRDVNSNHYSIGTANSLGQRIGVRWSSTGEPFALDRLPDEPSNASDTAIDINDFNFAVGEIYAGSEYHRAVLWTPAGDAIEMSSLVTSNSQWNFKSASTITNTGWICGLGRFDPSGPAEAHNRPFSILVPFAGTYGMGDANFDESINFADLLIVAQNYGSATNGSFDVGDFNLDGSVNFTDLLAIAQHYGESVSTLNAVGNLDFNSDWQRAQAMVPEPNLVGAMIGVGLMLRRRSER